MKPTVLLSQVIFLVLAGSNAINTVPIGPNPKSYDRLSFVVSNDLPVHPDRIISHPRPDQAWEGAPPPPATDLLWKRYVCKGSKLVVQMSWSDFDVAQALPVLKTTVQSPFMLADLANWGYQMHDSHDPIYCNFQPGGYWGISPWLNSFKISNKCRQDGGAWNAAWVIHADMHGQKSFQEQTYKDPDGVTRRVTAAIQYMTIDPNGGLMTQDRTSPWEALQELHPTDAKESELPALQRSSDIMWTMWERFTPEYAHKNIRMFTSLAISNKITLSLIRRALNSVQSELTPTAVRFTMDTEAGKALLSSPNGAGFAHFLIQRKAQVGLKHITGVYVFECSNAAKQPCLVFYAEELAEPVPRPKSDKPQDPANAPKEDDPNTKDDPEDTMDKQGPKTDKDPGEPINDRRLRKRNMVREHVFKLDERGIVTWSSS